MKKSLWTLVAIFMLVSPLVKGQEVLFSVGEMDIYEDEFIAVYQKNRSVGAQVDPKTPEEYLDLYVNFKLKIAEAYAQKRDTSSQFAREFSGYRKQLAKPYLTDKESKEGLQMEAYQRLQEEVRASHIMFALPADALPEDTLATFNALLKLRKDILDGKVTFESAARTQSADTYSAKSGGDLGYFTAFNMVYPFESAAYSLDEGEISMPVRTQFGYHILKLLDRRPANGQIRVRHIFFKADGKSDNVQQERAQRSAQEAYNRLMNGEDFIMLAKNFSEDHTTSERGGELEPFGINRMMPEFEEAAFALREPGDFSKPVRTSIGWHILQLIERIPIPSFEELEPSISKQVAKDSRANIGEFNFVKKLKKEYAFEVNQKLYDKTRKYIQDELYSTGKWEVPELRKDKAVVTFSNQEILQSELLEFWQTQMTKAKVKNWDTYLFTKFDQYCVSRLLDFEDSQLENKYPDFRHLVREYREGILLFDLTQDEVWTKASTDTSGIKAHYERIKENHMWGDRVNYTSYTCVNEGIAKKIAKLGSKGKWDKVAALLEKEDALDITVKDGLKEIEGTSLPTSVGIHGPIALETGGFEVVNVKGYFPAQPKSLKEIRGLVIASYQDELEKNWVASLKEKYVVQINEEVVDRVLDSLKE